MSTAFDDVNPWPSKAVPEAVGSIPGHNRPLPSDDALAEFKDQLHQRKSNFAERAESLVGSADRAVAIDEETFGRCGELKKQITAMLKLVDDAHVSAKAPYLEAGRAVDGAKKATRAPLEAAQAMVQCKLDAFARGHVFVGGEQTDDLALRIAQRHLRLAQPAPGAACRR